MNRSTGLATALVDVAGTTLEYRLIAAPEGQPAAPTIVFLHEGLGHAGTWGDFPDRLAAATGCGALIYSRPGYGASEAVAPPRPVTFLHDEALHVLPAVLEHFRVDDVILFGHSDGASIAIVYAGSVAGRSRALVLEAPHVLVEPECIERIARLDRAYDTSRLRDWLARDHGANTDAMFKSWTDVWLQPAFREWNIEECLPSIDVPVLVIQGEDDKFGTTRQVDAVVEKVRGKAESLMLPRCGHSPHREQPDAVLSASTAFIGRYVAQPRTPLAR